MTIRAQELLDASMELTLRPQKDDRKKLIAFIINEAADRLCTDLGEMECPISALRKLANEIEKLEDRLEDIAPSETDTYGPTGLRGDPG